VGAPAEHHEIYAKTPPQDTTVQGDQTSLPRLATAGVFPACAGTGHTSLVLLSPNGVKQSSTATISCSLALLLLLPRPAVKSGKTRGNPQAPAPWRFGASAGQRNCNLPCSLGNVTLVQETPAAVKVASGSRSGLTEQPGAAGCYHRDCPAGSV